MCITFLKIKTLSTFDLDLENVYTIQFDNFINTPIKTTSILRLFEKFMVR